MSLQNLKLQLREILKRYHQLKITIEDNCSDRELKDIAWVVQDFVNQNPQVIEEDDPLKDWLDRYRFLTHGG